MSEEKKDLLPCPFCGSSAMLEELGDHHGAYHNLGCSKRECPAHHAIYTESEAPVEDSVNWWNTRAALQESEAGAVKAFRHKDTGEIRYALSTPPHDETEWEDVYISTAPPSAQAIETAAIMKCVEVCQKTQSDMDDQADSITDFTYKDAFEEVEARLIALIPQDGRTQLAEFGWQVAHAILDARREGLLDGNEIHAIVTNLIGTTK